MDISLLNIMRAVSWDFRRDMAQNYANALKNAIELHLPNDTERTEGFFLSKKGTKDIAGNFVEKLYVGNIHRIEDHLYYNDEKLADDDQIINVVVVDGPVTRDGGACSYGTKDFRDQVQYANMIPQVVGHLFVVNTPGGESSCRNDYDEIFNSCRQAGKWTVGYVDGMCCSSGVNMLCRADRVVVRNPKDDFGCIGSMAAFWATPDGAVDRDGTRYVEIVGDACPEKNDWWQDAANGDYENLRSQVNRDTEEFHQTVRENRPLVKDWMLTGRVFEAQELIPALVDEIGTFERALECVFELADGTLPAARTVVEDGESGSPEIPANPDVTEDITTPKNDNDMKQEEMKAAEVAEQPTATQEAETPVTEQPAEEAPATEAPSVEEEGTEAPESPEVPEEAPAAEEPPAEEEPPAAEEANAELAQVQESLHAADALVEQRDKEIAGLRESLATLEGIAEERDAAVTELNKKGEDLATALTSLETRDATIAERDKAIAEKDALIEKLTKQVNDLRAEVKELASKPAPMVDATAGVPADNGTGAAPMQPKQCRVKRGMSYQEIRKAMAE